MVSPRCGKTRVKPLKTKITLPSLELIGALLLAEVMETTVSTLQLEEVPEYCGSDSTFVLVWIKKEPENLERTWLLDKGKRTEVVCFSGVSNGFDLLKGYSSFSKLVRLVAFITQS